MKNKRNHNSAITIRYAISRFLIASVFVCSGFLQSLFGNLETSSVVGFQDFEIKKGWTRLEMPFVHLDKKYFTLNEILKSDAAVEGDEVYYYTLSPTNFNLLLEAKAVQTDNGVHFYKVDKSRRGEGVSAPKAVCVDAFVLLPSLTLETLDGKRSNIRIRYFRKSDVTTKFTLSGEVPTSVVLDIKNKVSPFAEWIRKRICCEIYNNSLDQVISMIAAKEEFSGDHSFTDELLECARKTGPIYFYAYFKGKEDEPALILFNPINGKFINENNPEKRRGGSFDINTSLVARFGSVEDEFAADKIPIERRLPLEIVEEINRLLNARYFDDKRLFWIVKSDGSTRMVTYDKSSNSVIDCVNGARFNLERDDIVGFSDVPFPKDRSSKRPPINGKGRYLTRDEVKSLEKTIMPYHINFTFWGLMLWAIGQVLQGISTKVIAPIIPEDIPWLRKALWWIFYVVIPIGFIVSIIKKISSTKKGGDQSVDVPQVTVTSNSDSQNAEAIEGGTMGVDPIVDATNLEGVAGQPEVKK